MTSQASNKQTFQFSIQDYVIKHQGVATINLTIDYLYKQNIENYLDSQQVANYVDYYLKSYPNETDYWEVLNKNLANDLATTTISKSFGASGSDIYMPNSVSELSTTVAVESGSSDVPYPRHSKVTIEPLSDDLEGFSFSLPEYKVEHLGDNTIDVTLDYNYRPATDKYPQTYFEFSQVARYVEDFFVTYPNETDSWEVVNNRLNNQLSTDIIGKGFGFTGEDYYLAGLIDELSTTISHKGEAGTLMPAITSTKETTLKPGTVLEAKIAELQLRDNLPLLDLQDFSTNQELKATIGLERSASDRLSLGFYQVEDIEGSVIDQVSGNKLKPGDIGYASAALTQDNLVASLQGLQTEDGVSLSRIENVSGGSIFAPYVLTEAGNTYWVWNEANTDKSEHIRMDGLNTFLIEDQEAPNDSDFNDMILTINWSVV